MEPEKARTKCPLQSLKIPVTFTEIVRRSPKLLHCSQTTLPVGRKKKVKLTNFEYSFKDAI